MQSASTLPAVNPSTQQALQHIPATFEEALKNGWEFHDEKVVVSIDRDERKQRRYGVVVLRKEGCAVKLAVPYSATADGYRFRVPRIL